MADSMIYTSLSLVCGILEFYLFIYFGSSWGHITSNFGIKLQHLNNHANLWSLIKALLLLLPRKHSIQRFHKPNGLALDQEKHIIKFLKSNKSNELILEQEKTYLSN